MAGVDGHSEYEGGGVMPNTVFPHDGEPTPSEKLRLMSLTGQEDDTRAPLDPYFWVGNERPDPNVERQAAAERRRQERAIARSERDRYRETPI